MATTTARRAPLVPSSPPPNPGTYPVASRAGRAVLDGGWWPRSTDPFTELPGLVLALGTRFGVVRQLMLSSTTWDSRPRRLAVGAQVIRLAWFVSVDPGLAWENEGGSPVEGHPSQVAARVREAVTGRGTRI